MDGIGGDLPNHLRLRIPKGYSSVGNAPAAHELEPMTLSAGRPPPSQSGSARPTSLPRRRNWWDTTYCSGCSWSLSRRCWC